MSGSEETVKASSNKMASQKVRATTKAHVSFPTQTSCKNLTIAMIEKIRAQQQLVAKNHVFSGRIFHSVVKTNQFLLSSANLR